MAGFLKSLAKSAGPKLAIGLGLAGAALLATHWIDRPAGDDATPTTTAQAQPTAQVPSPPAKPVERRSDQGMAVDPGALRVKRVLKIDGPFRHGDYAWDEAGAPTTGPIIVTVDLRAQTLSVFRAGYEIGAAVILYGATDKPSPKGAFPIMAKHADYFSRTYDNAPMPFAQRLTSDGVFIHGSDVQWGRGTHGCIGVPKEFAEKLFGVTKLGDMVIITDGKMLDVSQAQVSG
ncbi:L,D-transpeptidase family protein [Sphingobium sp. AR-3-1]|uniref:L,D-transpeptidase family protein n=1 Tax=Sphingobium psychrophilum TaxID=2728834 RepID=A0A7X9WVM6_9SPHN|nr:L,D-transpeptidase family protein [Sphingobium psychrophilum]NML10739.1 L,D-transpeptidase family protein [Sphingobium psychrophilum]